MAIFRRECPICAGEFILDDEWPNPTCPYCKMPIEQIYGRDTDIQDVLERAARYRQRRDYSTAKELYQQVRGMAQSKPKFLHAALWGLALCEYGVTYVETEESKQRRSKLFERGLPHDTEASINLCRYPTCCLISEDASAARDCFHCVSFCSHGMC